MALSASMQVTILLAISTSTKPTAEERQAAALEAIADGQTTENEAAVNALLYGEV